jgi:hypothetical protein
MTLKTSATIPRGVKLQDLSVFEYTYRHSTTQSYPVGRGGGERLASVRSVKLTVFPAALPVVGVAVSLQTCKWSSGICNVL